VPDEKPSRLGRYELHEILGQGAMGVVYKAYDSFLDRTIAVKTYRQDIPFFQQARERFEREVRTTSRLSHPNIVVVYDGGLEGGVPFLAMELVEGPTLRDELASRGRLPREEALAMFFAIAEALAYAHSRGVVHRDLKPANILIAPGGVAKISDFGVAKLLEPGNSEKTQTLGTPGYMAPEQIQGKEIGPKSDVFALAILGYELLTGTRPFDAESAITLFFQILKTDPKPPSEIDPTLPKAFDRALARGLAKDPAERTPDAATLAAEVREAMTGRRSFAGGRRSSRAGMWIGATLAVFVVVAAVILHLRGAGEPSALVAVAEKTPTPAAQPSVAPTLVPLVEPTVTAIAEPTVEPTLEPTAEPTQPQAPTPRAEAPTAPEPRPTVALPVAKPTETRARPATIEVASDPPGADVLVDGIREGQTPLRLSRADAGNVLLELRKPGYTPFYKSLRVERGSQYTVRAQLAADPRSRGWVNVTSQPPGAKIALQGAPAGLAPLRLGPLEPGRYKIDAEFRGFPGVSQTIEMKPGETHTVNFIFDPANRR